jgi:hypothetical protein
MAPSWITQGETVTGLAAGAAASRGAGRDPEMARRRPRRRAGERPGLRPLGRARLPGARRQVREGGRGRGGVGLGARRHGAGGAGAPFRGRAAARGDVEGLACGTRTTRSRPRTPQASPSTSPRAAARPRNGAPAPPRGAGPLGHLDHRRRGAGARIGHRQVGLDELRHDVVAAGCSAASRAPAATTSWRSSSRPTCRWPMRAPAPRRMWRSLVRAEVIRLKPESRV